MEEREVEATLPGGAKFRARGYDLVTIIVCGFLAYSGWVQYRIILAMDDLAQSQRETTCIISLPQDERWKEVVDPKSFCKTIAKQGNRISMRLNKNGAI